MIYRFYRHDFSITVVVIVQYWTIKIVPPVVRALVSHIDVNPKFTIFYTISIDGNSMVTIMRQVSKMHHNRTVGINFLNDNLLNLIEGIAPIVIQLSLTIVMICNCGWSFGVAQSVAPSAKVFLDYN